MKIDKQSSAKRLSVLYIITQLELGGAQKSVLELAAALDKKRYQVIIISSKGLLTSDALAIAGITVKLLPSLRRSLNPLQDIWTLIILIRFIKGHTIDIVHTHSSKAGILGRWAAKFAGAPVILHTVHGWGFHQWQPPIIRRFFVFLERWTARITHRLIVVAQSDIQKGLAFGIGREEKYVLIHNGIAPREFVDTSTAFNLAPKGEVRCTAQYHPEQTPTFKSGCVERVDCRVEQKRKKKEWGIQEDTPLVGMVACFKPQKAPQIFLKAAALVKKTCPQARFILSGDGVLRKNLESLREELGLKKEVIFTGWQRDIPQIMAMLDVFVLTSLWEGLPVVFLEAMAAALPIVATPAGGAGEVIKEGVNGFLVPFDDVQAMAEKIVVLLQNKSLAQEMGDAGRQMLDSSFEKEYMVRRIDELYYQLASWRLPLGARLSAKPREATG